MYLEKAGLSSPSPKDYWQSRNPENPQRVEVTEVKTGYWQRNAPGGQKTAVVVKKTSLKKEQPPPEPKREKVVFHPSGLGKVPPVTFDNSGKPVLVGQQEVRDDPLGFASKAVLTDIGLLTFGVAPAVAVGGALVNVAVGEGVTRIFDNRDLTPQEALQTGIQGAAYTGIGAGILKGVANVAPRVASSVFGRAGVNAATGAGIGYVASGGDPESAVIGAVVGGGGSIVADKVVTPIARKISGYRVTKIKGGSEIERSFTSKEGIKSERLTELALKQERVKGSYGKFLKENSHLFSPEEVEFVGKETVLMRGGGEVDYGVKASIQTRPADPYVNAAQGKTSVTVKNVDVSQQKITTSSKLPGMVKTDTNIKANVIGPEEVLTQRTFTDAKVFGSVDRQIYIDYLKNVPKNVGHDWIKQMGGLSYEQIQKPQAPAKLRVFTDIIGVNAPTVKASAPQILIDIPISKSVQPVKMAKVETSVLSFPKQEADSFASVAQLPKQTVKTSPKQKQPQVPSEITIQETVTSTIPLTVTPTLPKIQIPRFPGGKLDMKEFSSPSYPVFSGYGRKKRRYPIKSAKQILKEIGL